MEPYILISISSGLLLLLHLVKVYKVKSIFQHQIHDWVLAILIAIPAIELLCINYRAIATVLCYRIKHTSSLLYVRVFAPDNSSSNGKGDESGYSPSNGNGDESGSSSSDDEGGAPGNSSLYGNGDESDSSLSYDEVVLERASIGRGD